MIINLTIKTSQMNRLQSFDSDIKNIIIGELKKSMPTPKILIAEFCADLNNADYSWAWVSFNLPSGNISINKWISDNGFVKSKKREATCVLVVGEKNDCDLWITHKKYWLTPSGNSPKSGLTAPHLLISKTIQ